MHSHSIKTTDAHPRPDLRVITAKTTRASTPAYTMGFTRRELRRLVAEMID